MSDILIATDTLNTYANTSAFAAVWIPGLGGGCVLANGGPDAPPDNSNYANHEAAGGGNSIDAPTTWGTNGVVTNTRTFTGLTPNAQYRIRWKMTVSRSNDINIDHYPAAHTMTVGLQANSDRLLLAFVAQRPPGSNPREDAGIPSDCVLYQYNPQPLPSFSTMCTVFGLCGWLDYELLTTADGSGHIAITFGQFDGRNFQSELGFDDITIWLVPPPVIASPPPAGIASRGGTLYVDSALRYDGRAAGAVDGLYPNISVTLSGGSTWLPGETLTLTASGSVFVSGDVGNIVVLHDTDITGATLSTIRFTIGHYTSATVVTGTADISIPSSLRGTAAGVWDRLIDQVAGLDHLEGEPVSILGDAHVIASPNNARLPIVTVSSGTVSLGDFYAYVVVGLPYLSDLETLDIDRGQGPSVKTNNMNTTRIGTLLTASRSFWVGKEEAPDDDPLENLAELISPSDPNYDVLIEGYKDLNIVSNWDNTGRVFLRSVDPVPLNVLNIVSAGFVPQVG